MASACQVCGKGLSFTQRARGRSVCDPCTAERKASLERAMVEYDGALQDAVVQGPAQSIAVARLRSLDSVVLASGGTTTARKDAFYRGLLDRALGDEVITVEEEQLLNHAADTIYGAGDASQVALLQAYRPQLFIAMVNDGRLPVLSSAGMILKKGEALHLVETAILMKEVVQREFRSGSRGVSFRIAKGVSYRVGASRGRMVEVGRTMEPADQGELRITSTRAVFTGTRKSIEMLHAKLLDLDVYTDGIQFHVSGRQVPPMFRVGNGPMVAAAVNAASQKLL